MNTNDLVTCFDFPETESRCGRCATRACVGGDSAFAQPATDDRWWKIGLLILLGMIALRKTR